MIDKHEGVTDWEAAARIAMARADREAEAKVIILDFIEEMRDTLTAILGACGRDRKPITENKCRKAIEGLSVIVDLADASAQAPSAVPRGVFVFSEERISIINRETGATEQKILLQYAIDGATFYAELDDDEELARYYEYLRDLRRR